MIATFEARLAELRQELFAAPGEPVRAVIRRRIELLQSSRRVQSLLLHLTHPHWSLNLPRAAAEGFVAIVNELESLPSDVAELFARARQPGADLVQVEEIAERSAHAALWRLAANVVLMAHGGAVAEGAFLERRHALIEEWAAMPVPERDALAWTIRERICKLREPYNWSDVGFWLEALRAEAGRADLLLLDEQEKATTNVSTSDAPSTGEQVDPQSAIDPYTPPPTLVVDRSCSGDSGSPPDVARPWVPHSFGGDRVRPGDPAAAVAQLVNVSDWRLREPTVLIRFCKKRGVPMRDAPPGSRHKREVHLEAFRRALQEDNLAAKKLAKGHEEEAARIFGEKRKRQQQQRRADGLTAD